jgi:hypothetical protein
MANESNSIGELLIKSVSSDLFAEKAKMAKSTKNLSGDTQ